MTRQPESKPSNASLILRSIWHWDLWAAIAVALIVAAGWMLTDYDAKWEWIIPVIGLSVTMAGLAWNQWNSLRSRLRSSDYGELLRLADESETEVKMPYFLTRFVERAEAFWSTGAAIIIEVTNSELVEALLLGMTGFLAVWSGLGVLSLALHSAGHDRRMAQIEAMREEMEATQRRFEAEKPQAKSTETPAPEAETC